MLGLELGLQAFVRQGTSCQFPLYVLRNRVFPMSGSLVESFHHQAGRLVSFIVGFESVPELAIALVGQELRLPSAVK